MKKLNLEIDGRSVEVLAAKSAGGTLWVHLGGETFTYEVARTKRSGKASTVSPTEIHAPMPGKIIKLLSQAGAKVAAGDVLLVMEAMKMEYTLKAAADGVVEKISCAPGDQVALGQLLVKLAL
jgi:acetyl/propionyl-CoA carboxylase alpha subunit